MLKKKEHPVCLDRNTTTTRIATSDRSGSGSSRSRGVLTAEATHSFSQLSHQQMDPNRPRHAIISHHPTQMNTTQDRSEREPSTRTKRSRVYRGRACRACTRRPGADTMRAEHAPRPVDGEEDGETRNDSAAMRKTESRGTE